MKSNEAVIRQAIGQSLSHDETVTLDDQKGLCEALTRECESCVVYPDRQEFSGREPAGQWHVHVRRKADPESRFAGFTQRKYKP